MAIQNFTNIRATKTFFQQLFINPAGGQSEIEIPRKEYEEFMKVLELPRAIAGGTRVIKGLCEWDQTNQFLPAEKGESEEAYEARLNRSTLFSVYKRTSQKMTGEVFRKPLTVNEEIKEELKQLEHDVDFEGNSLTVFGQKIFQDAIEDGVVHILVDMERVKRMKMDDGVPYYFDEGLGDWKVFNKAAEKKLGLRPYWQQIKPENLIGWRTERQQGRKILTQLRIYEKSFEESGAYGVEEVERIRVIEPYKIAVFRKQENEKKEIEWIEEFNVETTIPKITLVSIFFGDKVSDMTCVPPMEGLAYLNLQHFQSSSDQRNILHYARLVTWFGKCLEKDEDEEVRFGANVLVHTDHPEGDLKAVEHEGKAIEAGRMDIKDLENQMAMFGLTFMMPKTGGTTATEKAIDSGENDSALVKWVRSFVAGLDLAYHYSQYYLGTVGEIDEPENYVELDVNFKSFLSSYEAGIIIDAYDKGIIPRELAIEELKDRGFIRTEKDLVSIMAMARKEDADNFAREINVPLGDDE